MSIVSFDAVCDDEMCDYVHLVMILNRPPTTVLTVGGRPLHRCFPSCIAAGRAALKRYGCDPNTSHMRPESYGYTGFLAGKGYRMSRSTCHHACAPTEMAYDAAVKRASLV